MTKRTRRMVLAAALCAVVGLVVSLAHAALTTRVAVVSACEQSGCLPAFPVGARCRIDPSAVTVGKKALSVYTAPTVCFGEPIGCLPGQTYASRFTAHALSDQGYPKCPSPSSAFK